MGADGHSGWPLVPPRAAPESAGGRPCECRCRCAKTIENISRIKMVVARASGTVMASSLKQNKYWTKLLLRWRNSARPPRAVAEERNNNSIIVPVAEFPASPPLPPSHFRRTRNDIKKNAPVGISIVCFQNVFLTPQKRPCGNVPWTSKINFSRSKIHFALNSTP